MKRAKVTIRKDNRQANRGLPTLVAGCACLMLILSVPRFIAALDEVAANSVIQRLHKGDAVDATEIADAIAAKQKSFGWNADGRAKLDVAALYLSLPDSGTMPRNERMAAADAALRRDLSLRPMDATAWYLLASTTLSFENGEEKPVQFLKSSLLAGNMVPELTLPRLDLAFRLLASADQETLELINGQIALAWKTNPRGLANMAKNPDRFVFIRSALIRQGADIASFDDILDKS